MKVAEDYFYFSDYNILVNNEFKEIFLKYSNDKKIPVQNVELDEDKIWRNIRNISQLSIELTQDCNMQCKYCPYNGGFSFERKRSKRYMSPDVAFSGLNLLHNIFKDRIKEDFMIAAYGGEPLKNFKTLKYIVDYSKKKFRNLRLMFSVTTNGTILNDEILDFLISNNFTTMISLDGPPGNHDSKRVFPNNKGSFETVWENILKIKNSAPEYFEKKVLFSVVYSYDLSLLDCFNFFSENKYIKDNNIRFNMVSTKNSDYKKRYPHKHANIHKDQREILKRISQHFYSNKKERPPIFKEFDFSVIKELLSTKYFLLAGACDFSNKLFLDCEGRFHICEKINNKFPIGNIEIGIDIRKIRGILEDFLNITKKYCSECEVRSLCNPCYVNFAGNGKFEINKDFCEDRKKYLKSQLKRYIFFNTPSDDNIKKCSSSVTKKFHQYIKLEKRSSKYSYNRFFKGRVVSC